VIVARLLMIVSSLAAVPPEEQVGSIRGVVLEGAPRGTAVAEAEVVLRVKMEGEFVVAAETKTDESGRFVFQPLPIRPDLQFLPGANRGGIHYPGNRIQLRPSSPDVDITLVVHDVITSPSPLRAREHDIVIIPERGVLKVTETILIDNPTTKSYVGLSDQPDMPPITLKLAIPMDFERTTFHKEFFGRRFVLADGGVATSIPWKPGVRELKFTYVIPNTEQQRVWHRPLDLPCSSVCVRVRCQDPDSVSCNLPLGTVKQAGEAVFQSNGQTLPAGFSLSVELGRLPIPWMSYGRWFALGLLMILIGISAIVTANARRPPQ
jgi:hypothetical protein